ncbi:radical SAM family RiPP maturation amino acid epimerase [Halotia branconii]|uniref:Radical SAM family RiPP maturation amino acid epimerase n=1 Tax=Halotia branconii CENA392 TaxID=1539056 RepID=A0AAJ6NTT7_9CYAN|nr:radical SAM family RiPP maturation amino acid epimerase [Halotia branconii]WGV26497.1 radical SAM family RiPP maturation amino acid epimerase [Halotia branconii CENA392]
MMQVSNSLEKKELFSTNISQIRQTLKKWITNDELHWTEKLSDEVLMQELIQISQIQRFSQKWQADPELKKQLLIDSHQAVARYNLNINPEEIRVLWDKTHTQKENQADSISLSLKNYRNLINDEVRQAYEIQRIAGSSIEPSYKAWRERQMTRAASELNQLPQTLPEIHFPIAFELSKGCSVGCWFCGVSAPRLGDIFIYNQENARLWREVLELMKEILGPAAGTGFCYCASDPFDNPDYEKFCDDFHAILGIFPPTTTAQPLKNPDRTRFLLKLSLEKGCILNRFSILSLKMLDQVCNEFSSEELAFVDFVLQNKEADIPKSYSGRAREHNHRKAEKSQEILNNTLAGSTACVSGFLFNMVDRSVKLISPCNADERWPLGYRVYEKGTFTNADDLKILLKRMINTHMPLTLRPNDRISFRRDLKYENLPDGFQVSTKFHKHKFQNASYIRQLGEVIYKGDKTAEEIALLFNVCGIPSATIYHFLNLIFEHGVLDDEPKM